jgi:AcrR family transcriptional regulator
MSPEPLQPKAELRRRQILDAACDCVRRSGFHGASMAEIAAAAGVSVGQIYRYFENKEAIVAAIVDKDLAEMHAKFAGLEESGPRFVDSIVSGCSHAVDRNYDPDRAALLLEVLAEAARNPRVQAVVAQGDAVERGLVRKMLMRALPGGLPDAEMAGRGEVLMMLFDGMVMRSVSHPGGDRAAICAVLASTLMHLLSTDSLI